MIYYRCNILNIALLLFLCGLCAFVISHVQHVYYKLQKHERMLTYDQMVNDIDDEMRVVEQRIIDPNVLAKWTSGKYPISNDSVPSLE